MKTIIIVIVIVFASIPDGQINSAKAQTFRLSKAELMNKIRGGWAGQTIGVCYARPTESKYKDVMVPDTLKLEITEEKIIAISGDDDVYTDAKFLETVKRLGIGAHVDSFAIDFANADFNLYHANQSARYNILNDIMPPHSGNWKNGLHFNDLDFRIESDFIGLSTAGTPVASIEISDKIGHIMSCGDAYFAGVHVATMYSLSFVYDDIEYIINESLSVIPKESLYHKAMKEVIGWHKKYPDNWKKTWQAIEDSEWAPTIFCPRGFNNPYNIKALTNNAYILVGLLYGEKDFFQSVDIAMRCGKDSDCNASSVGGIIGTLIGFENIPDYWINPYKKGEDKILKYTSLTAVDCYHICYETTIKNILKYDGREDGDDVIIKYQKPDILPFEVAYPGISVKDVINVNKSLRDVMSIEFAGTGIAIIGPTRDGIKELERKTGDDFVAEIEVKIDGEKVAIRKFPFNFRKRPTELYLNFDLTEGNHTIELNWLNRIDDIELSMGNYAVFQKKPNLRRF